VIRQLREQIEKEKREEEAKSQIPVKPQRRCALKPSKWFRPAPMMMLENAIPLIGLV